MKLMLGSDFFCSMRENSSEHVRGIMPLSAPSGEHMSLGSLNVVAKVRTAHHAVFTTFC